MLEERSLPALKSREEMTEILLREEYGFLPDTPYEVTFGEPADIESRLSGGDAAVTKVDMTVSSAFGSHTFPVWRLLHKDGKKHPLIVFMDFKKNVPSFYYPTEYVADRGYDVLSFCYTDATSDDGDFTNGVAGVLLPEGKRDSDTCGKIMFWAFCARRLLDYAETIPDIDMNNCAVLGHSRLGKTALVAGMLDERFRFVLSNNAGASGDSLARGGLGATGGIGKNGRTGESIAAIYRSFPFWFCENFKKYTEQNYSDDFDQHFLLACSAPRFVHVASSDLDDWADPVSEQLCCLAAGKAWEAMGLPGLVHDDRIIEAGEHLYGGHVGYHRRSGPHFLSYHDWAEYMDFMDKYLA